MNTKEDKLIAVLKNMELRFEAIDKAVRSIHSYMKINVPINNIEYNFITDEATHNQLMKDNLEMIRHRSTSFDDYCRYAHYQIEHLLNYYFYLSSSSVEETRSFYSKFITFSREVCENRLPFMVWKPIYGINYVRNLTSHRGQHYNNGSDRNYQDNLAFHSAKNFNEVNQSLAGFVDAMKEELTKISS